MSDWANERAEQNIDLLLITSRACAVGVLAAMLRAAKDEGLQQAYKVDDESFNKVFGSGS